jgi:hypothetical protein
VRAGPRRLKQGFERQKSLFSTGAFAAACDDCGLSTVKGQENIRPTCLICLDSSTPQARSSHGGLSVSRDGRPRCCFYWRTRRQLHILLTPEKKIGESAAHMSNRRVTRSAPRYRPSSWLFPMCGYVHSFRGSLQTRGVLKAHEIFSGSEIPIADGQNAAFLLTGHIHGRLNGSSDLTFIQPSDPRLAVNGYEGQSPSRRRSAAQLLELSHLARVSQTLC